MTLCAGCELPIQDRFLLNVLDRTWHTKCVQCFECKASLTERCFYRNSKIYCRSDFFRLYGQKCAGCAQGISPSDLIRRARDKVFHLNCFTCMICHKQLSTGEELYVVDDNKFICKEDVLVCKARAGGSDGEDDCDMDSGIDTQGGNVSDKEYQLDNDSSRDDKENVITAVNNANAANVNNANYVNNANSATAALVTPNAGATPGTNVPPPPLGVGTVNGGTPANGGNGGAMMANGTSTPLLAANLGSPAAIKEEPGLGMMLASPGTPASNVSESSNLGPDGQQGRQSVGTNSSAGNCGDGAASPSPLGPTPEGGAAGGTAKGGTASGNGTGTGNNQVGAKRRGPRTTIKAKQLETLKAAFAATPKPTRHIREQLAQETGLNMRVIQVWFQNRRSKERRMKQLSALGARRHFFRNPRRLRGLRGEDLGDSPDMMGPGFGYIGDNGQEYYSGYQGYTDFFMAQGQEAPTMGFMPANPQGTPPLQMDPPLHPPSGMPDGQYMPGDLLPPASTPEPLPPLQPHDGHYGPPRSLGVTPFSQSLSQSLGHHHEMAGEAW